MEVAYIRHITKRYIDVKSFDGHDIIVPWVL